MYIVASKFPEIHWYNLRELLHKGIFFSRNLALIAFVALGMRSEGNFSKMENHKLISPPRQCASTPVCFDQGFRSKEECDNTGEFLILCPGSK
jgi:hypothetical protein